MRCIALHANIMSAIGAHLHQLTSSASPADSTPACSCHSLSRHSPGCTCRRRCPWRRRPVGGPRTLTEILLVWDRESWPLGSPVDSLQRRTKLHRGTKATGLRMRAKCRLCMHALLALAPLSVEKAHNLTETSDGAGKNVEPSGISLMASCNEDLNCARCAPLVSASRAIWRTRPIAASQRGSHTLTYTAAGTKVKCMQGL